MKRRPPISMRSALRSVAIFTLTIGTALGAACALAGELPRYKLKVGQELTYTTAQPAENKEEKDARPRATNEWVFTVAEQKDNGSWRILFRRKMSYGGSRENTQEGYFELVPDGRIALNPTLTVNANPTVFFPALPADEEALKKGWSSEIALDQTRCDFQAPAGPPAPDATTFAFGDDVQTVFSPIYLLTTHNDYDFDLQAGLVRKVTSTYKQGWPERAAERASTSAMELKGERQLDSPDVAALNAEMTRYFEVCAAYDEVMAQTSDFARMEEIVDRAAAVLKDAQGKFKLPAVEKQLDEKLTQHQQSRSYYLDNAERFAKRIGQPSEEWQTEDLDGHPRSLADYRGKVVLLDFWYRGCGWCIRAMPQIKQLVDDFPRDKFVVLGMNNDNNLDDARLVIEKMGLNYETLKNGDHQNGIHQKYGVQGWPTLVMLDGQGVVRQIHIGYSPNLRAELSAQIRKLLDEKVAAKTE
ncbi:MAG: TlpA family protein disulfide reductase [Pirellulales bacterium]